MSSLEPLDFDDLDGDAAKDRAAMLARRGRRPRDILLSGVLLFGFAWGLWKLRPAPQNNASASAEQTQTCAANLNQISRAFALYAQDFDGKFPRGTDPEDHNFPEIWRAVPRMGRPSFVSEARDAPMLVDLLEAYNCPRQAWHCPADVGWSVSQLPNLSASLLRDVRPSSWQQFGMSYFYLTEDGFRGRRARDLDEPAQAVMLFDGDLWHRSDSKDLNVGTPRRTLNVLFADGRVQNADAPTFARLMQGR